MTGFVIRLAATGAAFVGAAMLLPQIKLPATAFKDPVRDIAILAAIALVFGLVNGLVKPFVKLLSLPIRMMTLGLFSIVINAALLLLVAWIAGQLKLDFTIGGFPPNVTLDTVIGAVLGSLIIGVIGTIAGIFVKD